MLSGKIQFNTKYEIYEKLFGMINKRNSFTTYRLVNNNSESSKKNNRQELIT